MATKERSPIRILEYILVAIGSITCTIVPWLFAAAQSPLFPFPGLYFIEISLWGQLGLVSVVREQKESLFWAYVPWAVAGFLLAFVVLGVWSIGLFLVPATAAFLIIGFLTASGSGQVGKRFGLFGAAAVLQALIIMAVLGFQL